MTFRNLVFSAVGVFICPYSLLCESLVIVKEPIHLRSGNTREWNEFSETAQKTLSSPFTARPNQGEYSLLIRQRDVKDTTWTVRINGQKLGVLQDDERRMLRAYAIPAGILSSGENTFAISAEKPRLSDDIVIEEARIEALPVSDLLTQARVEFKASVDSVTLPVKITVVDAKGTLVPVTSLRVGAYEAIRTGVLYTPDGQGRIGLPAGEYRVFASRGFEYSAPWERIKLRTGDVRAVQLRMRHEVLLPRHISCDTHVHTLELSGHGDAGVDERVLTAAGEGLDMIVTTEHNKATDYSAALARRDLNKWTLSVPGNEVTTAVGHFNIFPVRIGGIQPVPGEKNWVELMRRIRDTESVKVVIQNHPRDLHSDYRPFDPSHYLASVGENLEGRPLQANAMEVVNSGAMASDPLQLVRDWMGLLTRGLPVAAVGSSDTHTVDFVPIGQARTYINTENLTTKWRDDIASVATQLAEGRSLVSYGLAVELWQTGTVKQQNRRGEVSVEMTVWGPSWSAADQLTLYSNGQAVWQKSLKPTRRRRPGIKTQISAKLDLPTQDAALVAVATGPGVMQPFWEVRKPYQPTSGDWTPIVMGISSAVWIDGDGDSHRTAPLAYAEALISQHGKDVSALTKALGSFDASVTLHVVNLLRKNGVDFTGTAVSAAFEAASSPVPQAYRQYLQEWRSTTPNRADGRVGNDTIAARRTTKPQ